MPRLRSAARAECHRTAVRQPLAGCAPWHVLILLVSLSSAVSAQDTTDAPDTVKRALGPFRYAPAVRFEVGVDTNVFNAPDDATRDAASVTTPSLDGWLRLGRMRLQTNSQMSLIYFFRTASERSLNGRNEMRLDLPVNRVKFYGGNLLQSSGDRVNLDIDVRARRTEVGWLGGMDVRITPKTTAGIGVRTWRLAFADAGGPITQELRTFQNRQMTTAFATVRRALTPLTTLMVTAESRRDRFELLPSHDSDSTAISPGVEFNRFALLRGTASVGYRSFRPLSPLIPPFSGVIAAANLEYTLKGTTRFSILAQRDVDYSIEITQPYYLLSGATVTATHILSDSWQVQGTFGRNQLAFQSITANLPQSAAAPVPPRTDRFNRAGGGIGYRLGPGTVIGVNADVFRRTSPVLGREYNDLRITTNVTYRD